MENHWETKYLSKSYHEETPTVSLQLINKLEGETIIDIGAGTSTLVDALLIQGKKMAVLDISKESLNINQTRLGKNNEKVEWILADITKEPTAHTYDIWHDRAVFHLFWDKQDQVKYKINALKSIKKGGYLLIGTFSMDAPTECCGLPIHRYSEEALSDFFQPEFEKVYVKHFNGVNGSAPYIFGLFKKN
jgi:2-polyprenyl-3-methyl-5-hydroxy-6-metoxy-1,4-benzoquinol methylase